MSATIDSRLGTGAAECLAAVFDEIIPANGTLGGWDGGVRDYLEQELGADLAWAEPALAATAVSLEAPAQQTSRRRFADLSGSERRALLQRHLADCPYEGTQHPLVRIAMEGYYAARNPSLAENWRAIGFHLPTARGVGRTPPLTRTVSRSELSDRYDVIVIGAGAGGAVLAATLGDAGLRVLLVERSAPLPDAALRDDHLHGKRLAIYGTNSGPGRGHPRVIEDADGSPTTLEADDNPWLWGLNAMCLGGGTRLWQGMAWRFLPEDLEMASRFGTPAGSSLADWPIGYAELEPYYDRAEHEIGVCGDMTFADRLPRRRDYPMPPLSDDPVGAALRGAGRDLGWKTGPIPFAINSIARGGRAACVRCPQCMGHTCPVDAKNGSIQVLRASVERSRCDVLTSAQALSVAARRGRAEAEVTLVIAPDGTKLTLTAGNVAVCAGAIETPRLLNVSGVGNSHVGRHLHSHVIHLQLGLAPEPIGDFRGPGHTLATLDFAHGGGAPFGGGVLFDAPSMLPLAAAQLAPAFGRACWGAEHRRWMEEGRKHVVGTMAVGQEVPDSDAAVMTSGTTVDRWGMPVAQIRTREHQASAEVRRFLAARCLDWLRASGCEPGPVVLSALALAEHAAGTCRMGDDPAGSACDRWGRLHGEKGIWVCDASLHPANGSVNPALTVMANAYRVAEAMLGDG